MATSPAYREQYDRMKRWYQRFDELNQGRIHNLMSENYLDEIYAFFQNCYHLKDWLKNDSVVNNAIQSAVEPYIISNNHLLLCADICNSLKHLALTRPRSGASPAFGKKQYAVNMQPGEPTIISLKYEVNTTSGPVDAFVLATDCVAAWEAFLKQHNLI
jgi:hypothetical protein